MTVRAKKRIAWSVSIVVGAVVLLGVVGPLIPYKEVENCICPVSGSTKKQITWFGLFGHAERNVSALEQWLKRREPSFEPEWRLTSRQTYYVLGRACGVGAGAEICQLSPILDLVVERLNDEKIAGLVEVLRQGSRDEQRQMIQSISDEVFERKSDAQVLDVLSDEGEMRVAACEYILRQDYKHLTNETVFISLTNNEAKALAARLPYCRFRPPDKVGPGRDSLIDSETGDRGFVLHVYEPVKNVADAKVPLSAEFAGSQVFFYCHLRRRPAWTAERIERSWVVCYPPPREEFKMRATVNDITMLQRFKGSAMVAHFDPRFVITLQIDSVTPPLTNYPADTLASFAIHSVAMLFPEYSQQELKGKAFDFVLSRETRGTNSAFTLSRDLGHGR